MKNELITLEREHLAATCGGTLAGPPCTNFETDLKARIDGEMDKVRSRLDHRQTTVPTAPTMPTVPTVPTMPTMPTTKYTDCFPHRKS
jgi:hypothetical protein